MLSICIPIFNVDVRPLVTELVKQIKECTPKVELILIDDGSTQFLKENKELESCATVIFLRENIGRAKIRNLFLEYSKEAYLLFLDCDVLINDPNFIAHYLLFLKNEPAIVCGGHFYNSKQPKLSERLRWKYGIYKESKSAEERKKSPNKSFMTNNFVIKKSIFQEIRFDERLRNYGHEDTLFGLQLKKKQLKIEHIDNQVLIGDSESNEVFLHKTEIGVKNLAHILSFPEFQADLWNEISLLSFYKKTKKVHFLLLPIFTIVKPILHWLLKKGMANLLLFDFYKLGILMLSLKKKA